MDDLPVDAAARGAERDAAIFALGDAAARAWLALRAVELVEALARAVDPALRGLRAAPGVGCGLGLPRGAADAISGTHPSLRSRSTARNRAAAAR